MSRPNSLPLYAGNFSDKSQTVTQLSVEHLMPSGEYFPGLKAMFEIANVPEDVTFAANPHTDELPSIEDKIRSMGEKIKRSHAALEGTDNLFEEYRNLIERSTQLDLSDEERLARWMQNPDVMLRGILRRSENVLMGLEHREAEMGYVHPGAHGSVYYATKDQEGEDTITKVSWFGRHAGTYENGDRPDSMNRRQWAAYKLLRTFVATPYVRIYTCDADADASQVHPARGYSIGPNGIIELKAAAIPSVKMAQQEKALTPYFTVTEKSVVPVVNGSKMKPYKNLGQFTADTDDSAAQDYLHLLPQINGDTIIVGAGLGRTNKKQLAQFVMKAPVQELREVDQTTAALEKQLSKPDALIL